MGLWSILGGYCLLQPPSRLRDWTSEGGIAPFRRGFAILLPRSPSVTISLLRLPPPTAFLRNTYQIPPKGDFGWLTQAFSEVGTLSLQ